MAHRGEELVSSTNPRPQIQVKPPTTTLTHLQRRIHRKHHVISRAEAVGAAVLLHNAITPAVVGFRRQKGQEQKGSFTIHSSPSRGEKVKAGDQGRDMRSYSGCGRSRTRPWHRPPAASGPVEPPLPPPWPRPWIRGIDLCRRLRRRPPRPPWPEVHFGRRPGKHTQSGTGQDASVSIYQFETPQAQLGVP